MELLSQKWQLSNSPLFHLHLLLMSSYGPFSHPTSGSNWWSGRGTQVSAHKKKKDQRGVKVSLHDYWKVGEPESTAGFHSSFLFFAECTPSFQLMKTRTSPVVGTFERELHTVFTKATVATHPHPVKHKLKRGSNFFFLQSPDSISVV